MGSEQRMLPLLLLAEQTLAPTLPRNLLHHGYLSADLDS